MTQGRLAVALLGAFLAIWLLVATGTTQAFDATVMRWLDVGAGSASAQIAAMVSDAASFLPRAILVLITASWLATRGRIRAALVVIGVVFGGAFVAAQLKLLFGRARPDLAVRLATVDGLSFPSGHAANSMITALALARIAVTGRWRGVALGLAIAASLIVGIARVVLHVHWPSDVLAGWCFGAAWVLGLTALFARPPSPHGSP